jgi:hypothetical protein
VVELLIKAFHDVTVALQAQIFSFRLIMTALTGPFGKRRMLILPQQSLVVRLMRMVTFKAIHLVQFAVQMAGTELFVLFVTSKTELCPFLAQQHWLVATVSIVTNMTFPLVKGGMTVLFFLLKIFVAS